MHPILIEFGDFALHTYGAMGAIGFVILCVLSLREAQQRGWDNDKVVDVIFWGSLGGIVGARVLFFVQNPIAYTSPIDIVNMRTGGMVFYGAFAGLPVGWFVLQRTGLPAWDVVDVFAKLMPLAHGMSRLGCLGAGCCYGLPASVPWAVTYTHPLSAAPHDVPLHPTQLYEAIGLFALSAFLTWRASRKRFSGEIILDYVLGYAVLRSITELFRGDADRYFVLEDVLGPVISTSQGLAIVFFVMAALAWPRLAARGRSPEA